MRHVEIAASPVSGLGPLDEQICLLPIQYAIECSKN